MTKEWKQNFQICPLNKRIHLLIQYRGHMYECIGTLIRTPYGIIAPGQCIEGSAEIFFYGDLIAWSTYLTDEEAEALL